MPAIIVNSDGNVRTQNLQLMTVKEKIVAASASLFTSHGVKTITMDEVAANLGMSKRTIYENFSNKEELIAACTDFLHRRQETMEQEIIASSETIVDEMFALFAKIDENFASHGRYAEEIKKYYPDVFEEKFCSHYDQAAVKFKKRLQRGIEQGIILPDTNLDFAVHVILETLYNLLSRQELVTRKNISIVNAFKYVLIYFFRGISTNKGIRLMDEKLEKFKTYRS